MFARSKTEVTETIPEDVRHMVVHNCFSSRDTHRGSQITNTEVAFPSGLKGDWEWWRMCPPQLPEANAWHQRTLPHRQLSVVLGPHRLEPGSHELWRLKIFPWRLGSQHLICSSQLYWGRVSPLLALTFSPVREWAHWTRKGKAQPSKYSARFCEEVGHEKPCGL